MKKILCMLLITIMCVTLLASCNKDSSTEADNSTAISKSNLSAAYISCCKGEKEEYAELAYDNMSLTIDTNPDDSVYNDCESNALSAIVSINSFLDLPSSLIDKMSSTRALDGMQSQDCGTYTVTWNYHPDNGMKVIYEVNP